MTKELIKPAVARHFTKVVISWRAPPQSISPQSTTSSSTSSTPSTTVGNKRPNISSPSTPNKKQKPAQISANTPITTKEPRARQKISVFQVTNNPRTGQANKRVGGNGGNNRSNGDGGYGRIAKIARNKNNEKNLYVPPPRRGT
ncbi:11787_t:CDS:2 [Funneliformis caledonium]|uniref:11787_t:CDS:1 n=1 Tax=Funneliformis caledonium TaxID=1117310 RepID=A0A9N9FI83_9GLOM|nr:11787_t:CDS:2 [Funneliformis caledonium]